MLLVTVKSNTWLASIVGEAAREGGAGSRSGRPWHIWSPARAQQPSLGANSLGPSHCVIISWQNRGCHPLFKKIGTYKRRSTILVSLLSAKSSPSLIKPSPIKSFTFAVCESSMLFIYRVCCFR